MCSVRKTAALNEAPGVGIGAAYYMDRDSSIIVTMMLQKLHDICVNTHA